ncbi:MAG: HAD-IC family P-type ATPase [Chloroflexi bacterium]|nr:HAD-IC family P-type ATPase [Chloroflexota bacterium]
MSRMFALSETFRIPAVVLLGILVALALQAASFNQPAAAALLAVVVLGSYQLFYDTVVGLLQRRFALDFIAVLAILVSVGSGEFLVAAVIALMLSSGQALEAYGVAQAKKSLTGLIDRIPRHIVLWEGARAGRTESIAAVQIGQEVLVRRGEVIPLDGVLVSDAGLTDESSLTGEPYMIDKVRGDQIRSGTVNVGDAIVVKVIRREEDSTYHKIVKMVEEAQEEKAPLVRLADRYSVWFTGVTLVIAAFAYLISGDVNRILAVLVVATPCPLILATPIALMGGVNAAARKRIIVKKLSALEVLSRVRTIILDKTGTIAGRGADAGHPRRGADRRGHLRCGQRQGLPPEQAG